jgi:hypothetical protein
MAMKEDYHMIVKDNINDMEQYIGLFVIFSTLNPYFAFHALIYDNIPDTYVAFVGQKDETGIAVYILLTPNTLGGNPIVCKQKLKNDYLLVKPMKKSEITSTIFGNPDKLPKFSSYNDDAGNLITDLAKHACKGDNPDEIGNRLYKYKDVDKQEEL